MQIDTTRQAVAAGAAASPDRPARRQSITVEGSITPAAAAAGGAADKAEASSSSRRGSLLGARRRAPQNPLVCLYSTRRPFREYITTCPAQLTSLGLLGHMHASR